jgi:hypothetical protein
MAAEKNPLLREEIITAVGAWGESLEVNVKEELERVKLAKELPFTGTDTSMRKVMVEFGTAVGALVIKAAEEVPNWVESQVLLKSTIKSAINILAEREEIFTTDVIKKTVNIEVYFQNLVSNPQISETAKQYGLKPQDVARDLAKKTADGITQIILLVVPLVFKEAQETRSLAEFEVRLTEAIAHYKEHNQPALAITKEIKGDDPIQKKKWWQIRK